MQMETKHTHMISCEMELEWVKELADLIGVKHEQYDLLMDEETFQVFKKPETFRVERSS
jgi:hypothetical protein